ATQSETTSGCGSETPKARSKADETPGVAGEAELAAAPEGDTTGHVNVASSQPRDPPDEEHLRARDWAEAADNYAENLRILEGNPVLMLAAVQLYKARKLAELMPTPGAASPATTQEDDELTAFFESDTIRLGSS
ncbi:hypothetical protein HK105_209524, partial [Polyrhizophydium stewartii]